MRRISTRPLRARGGVSLIELLITITMGGVVMMLGMGTLHLLLRTDQNLTHSLQRRQTVSQLSAAFRNDIHAAREVEWTEPKNEQDRAGLTLLLAPGHRVRYTTDHHSLLRTETQKEKTLQTARFRFWPGTEISFQAEDPRRVALVIQSPNPTTNPPHQSGPDVPKRKLTIQAVTGRDHRFEETQIP